MSTTSPERKLIMDEIVASKQEEPEATRAVLHWLHSRARTQVGPLCEFAAHTAGRPCRILSVNPRPLER
jgi:hypothetical protein